jgi:hypothetical protein
MESGVPRRWLVEQDRHERRLDEQAALDYIAALYPESDPLAIWEAGTEAERERWIREAA